MRFCAARRDSGLGCRGVDFPLVRFGVISVILTFCFAPRRRLVDLAFEVLLLAALRPFLLRFRWVDRP